MRSLLTAEEELMRRYQNLALLGNCILGQTVSVIDGKDQATLYAAVPGTFVAGILVCDGIDQGTTQLESVATTGMKAGTMAFVRSVGDYFRFAPSADTGGADTLAAEKVVQAASSSGRWLRMGIQNPVWQARTAWSIDTTSGNDENDGASDGTALKTLTELARRIKGAKYTTSPTFRILSSLASTDQPYMDVRVCRDSSTVVALQFQGVPAAISGLSGTMSSVTSVLTSDLPTTNVYKFTDSGLPTSFTASGGVGGGVIYKRTSSTALWWWPVVDLGSKTLHISVPDNLSDTITSFSRTQAALANGDTYQGYTLPTFNQLFGLEDVPVTFQHLYINPAQATDRSRYRMAAWKLCSFVVVPQLFGSCTAYNCASYSTNSGPIGNPSSSGAGWFGGLIKGSGATTFGPTGGGWNLNATGFITCYGAVFAGLHRSQIDRASFLFYSCTASYLVEAGHNSDLEIDGMGGANNTVTHSIRVRSGSHLLYLSTTNLVSAGMANNETVLLDPEAYATSALPIIHNQYNNSAVPIT